MAYCPDCGVDIGAAAVCPLCGAKNPRAAEKPTQGCGESEKDQTTPIVFLGSDPSTERFTPEESRKILWEVLSVAFVIAVGSLLGINFLIAGSLSWSLYPVASFVFVWVVATSILVMRRAPKVRILLTGIAAPLYLLALGVFTGDVSWAWRLAVPLSVFVELVGLGVVALIHGSKRKGLNVFSFILVGAALTCLGVEICVDLFVARRVMLTWSVITALALVPIATFLMYLHYRVAKSTNLHRLFKL